jgi:hypothetical protein
MAKKKTAKAKPKPRQKKQKSVLLNFDTIKLNNAGLLNDQKISAAYSEFLFQFEESFKELFKQN